MSESPDFLRLLEVAMVALSPVVSSFLLWKVAKLKSQVVEIKEVVNGSHHVLVNALASKNVDVGNLKHEIGRLEGAAAVVAEQKAEGR